MNTYDEPSPNSVSLDAIDRLVAGDMPEAERRALLFNLENEPNGWRRCALAFLEDQAWRLALTSIAASKAEPPQETVVKRPRKVRLFRRVAMAASFLALAFSSGFVAGHWGRDGTIPNFAGRGATIPTPTAPILDSGQVREVGWIDLDDGTNGELPPRRVPIVSGPGLDEKWLREQAPTVPDYVRAQWERQGFQIQEKRNLVSVLLEDGRRVSIPVDEVALDYVGQTPL